MKKRPQIRVVSQSELQRRFGLPGEHVNAAIRGNRIYATKKTSKLDLEHELSHHRMGHKPAKLNAYQFAMREVKAQKMATDKLKRSFKSKYLRDIADDAERTFKRKGQRLTSAEKKELVGRVTKAVNKAATKLGIEYRVR